jgi:hypothetical protein
VKDVICLRDSRQVFVPSVEERITLAKFHLGLQKISFDADGDSRHVHHCIMNAFPILDVCGGYTLLRTGENMKDLLELDSPDGGIDVNYLRNILRQAKLYIRPLQCDIPVDDMKLQKQSNENSEPEESCHSCGKVYRLSELRKHVLNGLCAKKAKLISDDESSDQEECNSVDARNLVDDDLNELETEPDIQELLLSFAKDSNKATDLSDILNKHKSYYLHQNLEETFRITVRRSHILEDTINLFKQPFDDKCHLSVHFIGESAVDLGGPLREFFQLFINSLKQNNSLFIGPINKRVLRHNTSACIESMYEIIGKVMSLSIIHGGSEPLFLAPSVVDYIVKNDERAVLDDVPCLYIQSKLQKILDVENEEQFSNLLYSSDYDFLSDCSLSSSSFSYSQKHLLVQAACGHLIIYSSLAELQQLKRGIRNTANMGKLMDLYPDLCKKLFLFKEKPLTAAFIEAMYTVDYSPIGCSSRITQEQIMMNWFLFLREIESTVLSFI